jgi:hypothetical protein
LPREVTTTLNGLVYVYKNSGKIYTWFDPKNLVVPVILHTKLREKALSEGADESIFLSEPKLNRSDFQQEKPRNEVEVKSKTIKKSTLGFNPFKGG